MCGAHRVISTIKQMKCRGSSKEKGTTAVSKIWVRLGNYVALGYLELGKGKYRMEGHMTQRWRWNTGSV